MVRGFLCDHGSGNRRRSHRLPLLRLALVALVIRLALLFAVLILLRLLLATLTIVVLITVLITVGIIHVRLVTFVVGILVIVAGLLAMMAFLFCCVFCSRGKSPPPCAHEKRQSVAAVPAT